MPLVVLPFALMVVVVVVVVVVGIHPDGHAEPRKCCFDKEFTATLGRMGGSVDLSTGRLRVLDGYMNISYDYYRRKQGTVLHLKQPDGSYTTVAKLKDYDNLMEYSTEGNSICTSRRMSPEEVMLPPCIPDDATYLGPAMFGYGPSTLNVNTWELTVPQARFDASDDDILMKMVVTREHCVPFAQVIMGSFGGNSTEMTFFYTSYHPGIADLNALDIPTDCQHPSDSVGLPHGRHSVRRP